MKEVIAQSTQPAAVDRSLETGQPSTTSNLDRLAVPASYEPEVRNLELRQADQRQEQQLYGLLDAQAVALVILEVTRDPSDEAQRRRLEAVQAELLLSELEREKKKRGRSGFFGEVTFRNLAAVLGADAAESISQKLEKLSQGGGGGLQSNPSAVAQIAKEIATSLQGHDTLLRLGVSPTQVERTIAEALLSRISHISTHSPESGVAISEPSPPTERQAAVIPPVLDHPVAAIRETLVRISKPAPDGTVSPLILPEMEEVSRHILPTAQQHGFNGDRIQLAQTLYLVAHQLENARIQDSAIAREMVATMFVQHYGTAKSELVDVALDLVTRMQHAKALSTGQVPPERAGAALEHATVNENSPRQRHGAYPNLAQGVELKIAPETAPRFILASRKELVAQLNRLGTLAAQAAMRGEPKVAASIRQEMHDTIQDNRRLVDAMSDAERQGMSKHVIDAEVAETERIKIARARFTHKLITETEKLALASAESLTEGTLTEEQVLSEFRDAASSLLASTETYLVGKERDAALQGLEAHLKEQIREKRAAVLESDQQVLAQLAHNIEAELTKAPEISISHAISQNKPLQPLFDAAVEKARNDLRAKMDEPQFEAIERRNPEARAQLERRFDIAVEESRRTIANLGPTQLQQLLADPVRASKSNPQLTALLLKTPEGLQALHSKLDSLTISHERIALLKELQTTLGLNSFASIIDHYDRRYGRPLSFDLLSMSDHTSAARQALVKDCFGPNSTLFTVEQRERFLSFARQEAAMTMAVVSRERRLLRDTISSTERGRADLQLKIAPELAKLGITGLADVSASEMQKRVLQELAKQYPGLEGQTWDEAIVSLERLGGAKDLYEFKEYLVQAKKIDSRTATFMQFEEVERHYALLREVLPVVSGQMRAFGKVEEDLSRLRSQEAHGAQDEPRLLEQRYKEIYGATFGAFSDASFQGLQQDALLYLDGLHRRIETSRGDELVALCAERDSIEWQSVVSRIGIHLDAAQPNAHRSLELLAEFELVHGIGPTQRSKVFRDLAHNLHGAISAVENFAARQENLSRMALDKARSDLPMLDMSIQGKEEEVQAAKEHHESFWFNTADYRKAGEDLSSHRRELAKIRAERETTQRRLNTLESLPETVGVETRKALLGQLLRERPETAGVQYLTANDFKTRLSSHGSAGLPTEAFDGLTKLFEEVQSSGSEARRSLTDPSVGAALTSFAAAVRSPIQERELITKLEDTLRHDEGTAPSDASLRALQDSVDSSSALGQHIQTVFAATTDSRQRMDQLYARLPSAEVAKVRTFLVTHDRPQLLTASLPSAHPEDAKGVWNSLTVLSEEQVVPLLGNLTVERQLLEVQTLFRDIPDSRREAAMAEYERATGRSIGASILDLRPRGNTGISFVLNAADNPLVTEADLRPYFPDGKVPESLEQRRTALLDLFKRDAGRASFDEQAVQDLAQDEARERAALQVALSLAVQQGRTQDAEGIRADLDRLDEDFSKRSEELIARVPPDYAARADLRDAVSNIRSFHTQSSVMEIAGPYGPIARAARDLLSLLEHRPPKLDEVMIHLREANHTRAEMHLLRAYYTHHALAPRVTDSSVALRGDLQADLETLSADSVYDTKLTSLLLAGGAHSLTEYDLEMLSKGIRTENPQLATRAMVALSAARGTEHAAKMVNSFLSSAEMKDRWSKVKDTPAFSGVRNYSEALAQNDTVKMAAVELRNVFDGVTVGDVALATTIIKYRNNPRIRNTALVTAAYSEIFGSNPVDDLIRKAPALAEAWNGVLSSDPAQRVAASVAFAKAAVHEKAAGSVSSVLELDLVNRGLSLVATKEEREQVLKELNEWAKGLPRSAVYTDGEAGHFVEYIKSRSTEFAEADAAILEAMFKAPDQQENTSPISADQLARYLSERDTLMYQMREIDAFHAYRSQVREQSANFHITICNTHNRSVTDYENRTLTAELARTKVIADNFMRQNQAGLIERQLYGLRDIQCMRETMRLRGVALLRDISTGIDRGLSAELNNQTFSDLKERDKKIEWIVARSDAMQIWHREAKAAQEELAKWDRRIEIAHTVAKVVVVVGLSFVPFVGPGGAFLVATAWNAADKGFKMAYNGLSPREALRQFAIELAFDAAFAGWGAFKVVRVVTKPGADAVKEGVKPIVNRVVIRNLFNTPAKFEGTAFRHTLIHRLDVFRGAEGKLTKAAFEGAERLFQNPKVLGNMLVAEIRGSFWNGSRILAYTPLPFMPNRTPPAPLPVQPAPVQPPRNEGPGTAGVAVKPVVVPPNQPLQAAAAIPSENERQEIVALVQNLKASLENLVPNARDAAKEGLKTVERMLEDRGWSLEDIKGMLETVRLQAATPPSPAQPEPTPKPPPQKTEFEEWLARNNLYEGVFDFLNSYNPWTDLLAGLGRVQPSTIPFIQPPYFPPPVKPPQAPEPKRTSRDDPPDNGATYGPRLRLDNGDGNSYTRYRDRADQENVVRMFKHDPLSAMHGVPNQAARMAAEALDARAKTQLLLAAEAAQLAMQQTQQLAHVSAATHSRQASQTQQETHRHQQAEAQLRATALEQAYKAMDRLTHTEQSVLTATQQLPRMAEERAGEESFSRATAPSTTQVNTTRRSRALSRREEAEFTALAALQSGEVRAQLQGPAARIKHGDDALQSTVKHSGANSPATLIENAHISPSRIAHPSISEPPRLKTSKEPSPLSEQSVAASERPSFGLAQVVSQAEVPRASQQHTQIHIESPMLGASPSDAISMQERQSSSYWNTPSATAYPQETNNIDVETSHDGSRAKAATKARKDKLRRDAQLRQGIIQQLLTQSFDVSKREKLLAVLIKLGISEKEYHELVARVGEQEAQRMAERSGHEQRFKDAEKIAVTTSGELVAESQMAAHPAREERREGRVEQQPVQELPQQTALSRADLYRSLQRAKGSGDA